MTELYRTQEGLLKQGALVLLLISIFFLKFNTWKFLESKNKTNLFVFILPPLDCATLWCQHQSPTPSQAVVCHHLQQFAERKTEYFTHFQIYK
jgi:hypothetical protein